MRRITLAFITLAIGSSAIAQTPLPSAQIPQPVIEGGRLGAAYAPLINELRNGGYILLFRHDRTEVVGDWDYVPFVANECERQRNLSEVGIASARAIGDTIRALGIPIGRVITSGYCRAIDTARYAFGGVHQQTAALIGPTGEARTLDVVRRDVDAIIRQPLAAGNLVLIGHHGTIDAYTDRMLDEGDALILKRESDRIVVVAHMPAARWEEILRDQRRALIEPRGR